VTSLSRASELFEEHFGTRPSHAARAPGRVNLIGEHTDYNGLPVLPVALQKEAGVAFRPRDDGLVRLRNADDEFDPVEFEISPALDCGPAGHWGNYAMAPAHEMARRFAIWRGMDAVVASDVPVAAGLSSSSALVNAIGIALAYINEVELGELALADLMADAERFTGTRGGGMDQAVSMAARAGCAAKITFSPLRLRHVPIPDEWLFVVADTGVRAEKSGAAQQAYNLRRQECEEAFSEVAEELVRRGGPTGPPRGYPQLLRAMGVRGALDVGGEVLEGNLLRRFRHVVTEGQRVADAVEHLRSADLLDFGNLMDASHGSLRTDFHVSSSELDELVSLAKEGGAYGARLTGAGFGGCIVALTDRVSVDGVLDTLVRDYYEPRGLGGELDRRLFVAIASGGASVAAT
jgi:galactokinase